MSGDPKDPFDPEPTTLVTCLACGGDWLREHDTASTYRHVVCQWCTRGSMSTEQIAAWKEWRGKHQSQP